MAKLKVFIDTNIVNNPTPIGGLFGNARRLKCLEGRIDIIIPKIVLDELIEHKRRAFELEKEQLLNNKLIDQIADRNAVTKLEFCEPCILFDEDIVFSTEDINDEKEFLEWSRGLALQNKAPFDNKSDKGFKDSIVAFTIDEYLSRNPKVKKPVVLVSADGRLGEYFQDRNDVLCLKNLDELSEYIDGEEKHKQNIRKEGDDGTGRGECIKKGTKRIELPQLTEARQLLTDLRNSGNFATTHKIIADLQPYLRFLTDEDFIDILLSTLNNSQIMWLTEDNDVKSLIKPIFDKYKDALSIEQYNDFVNRTGWEGYRIKEPVEIDRANSIPF